MQTVGLVGVGKIGLSIAENLIKSGYRVLGYRRSSLSDFEKIGGVPARSPADIGAQTDIVLTCLPSSEALDEVVQGKHGLIHSAHHGPPLAAKGATFVDGERPGRVLESAVKHLRQPQRDRGKPEQ